MKDADGARTRSDQKVNDIVVPSCLKDADGARTRSDQKLHLKNSQEIKPQLKVKSLK